SAPRVRFGADRGAMARCLSRCRHAIPVVPMLTRIVDIIRSRGLSGVLRAVRSRVVGTRLQSRRVVRKLVAGKAVLEGGGPTGLFKAGGLLPVYQFASALDNCNFTTQTIWEGTIREGQTFQFNPHRAAGRQFIAEATDLRGIAADTYDFVVSSHTLEHC